MLTCSFFTNNYIVVQAQLIARAARPLGYVGHTGRVHRRRNGLTIHAFLRRIEHELGKLPKLPQFVELLQEVPVPLVSSPVSGQLPTNSSRLLEHGGDLSVEGFDHSLAVFDVAKRVRVLAFRHHRAAVGGTGLDGVMGPELVG